MKVAAAACGSYEQETVSHALECVLAPLGGLRQFVRAGQRVLIKPNLLLSKKPEECATTHPAVVEAVACAVRALGADAVIADSPGGLYNRQVLKSVYTASGMNGVSERSGVPLNYDVAAEDVPHPEGHTIKRLTVIKPVLDADVVINICKLKTHGMTMYTGAVKNLFGVIPGTRKAEYHFRMPELGDFCDMLVDINTFVRPALSIMDGVMGMEGAGPSGGTPRKMGLLLASESPFCLDLVASSLIGFAPGEVETVACAVRRGLCPADASQVETVGEKLAPYRCQFQKPPSHGVDLTRRFPGWFRKLTARAVRPSPRVRTDKCVGCGVCAQHCPAKTIAMRDRRPDIDLGGCIRCFCCQELCAHKAIAVHRPLLMRVANRL